MSKFLHGSPLLMGDATIPGVPLSKEVKNLTPVILKACADFGLDFYPTVVQMCRYDEISELAAYGGFPVRYPHWRFGMEYEELQRGYEFGMHKIFEMVTNTNPCYIYCLNSNTLADNLTVIAHATGHNHFFKNNIHFLPTTQNAMNELANHGSRIRRYMSTWGKERVTEFIDHILRIDTLIDHAAAWDSKEIKDVVITDKRTYRQPRRLYVDPDRRHMENFVNPKEWKKKERERCNKEEAADDIGIFKDPTKNILKWIKDFAPLKPWQQDIISILYEEALYFSPQGETKVANEGLACACRNTLVITDLGILPIGDIVDKRLQVLVHDGNQLQRVVNWFAHGKKPTARVVTNRGFVIDGSVTHRVLNDQYEWKRLDELVIGDRLTLSHSNGIWTDKQVELAWKSKRSEKCTIPTVVGVDLGALLGYLVGDGHISMKGGNFGLTSVDDEQAEWYEELIGRLFGPCRKDSGVLVYSKDVEEFLVWLGAQEKSVPGVILSSCKAVQAAFLRAFFDVNAYVDTDFDGVILSAFGSKLVEQIQVMLLNFGVLSNRLEKDKDNFHICITGRSAVYFFEEIGFGLLRKQAWLNKCVTRDDRRFSKTEDWTDEVVEITYGEDEVFDISVDKTHRYVAQGFVNHNSWVDYNIMAKQGYIGLGQEMYDTGIVDYAAHKMSVLGGQYSTNPYKLGFEILCDIEERWNKGQFGTEWEECDNIKAKENWDRGLGLGKEKVFEVVKYYNDANLINDFFTEDLCRKLDLYEYKWYPNGEKRIESRDYKKIKQQLISRHINRGLPDIRLVDPNHRGRGHMFLQHYPDMYNRALYAPYVRDVLTSIRYFMKSDVFLATYDDDGEEIVYICHGHDADKGVEVAMRNDYERSIGTAKR